MVTLKLKLTFLKNFRIYADKLNFYNNSGGFAGSNLKAQKLLIQYLSLQNVYDKGRFTVFKGPQAYLEDSFFFNIKYRGCTEKMFISLC